jgi:exopolysaccharide biosynthesis polyprenyl glycosylphosphotransferase
MLRVKQDARTVVTSDDLPMAAGLSERSVWPVICGLLLVTDALTLGLGAMLAYLGRFDIGPVRLFSLEMGVSHLTRLHFYERALVLYVLLTMALLGLMGGYRRLHLFQGTKEYTAILQATGLATLLAEFASYLSDRHYPIARGWLLLAWLLGGLLTSAGRFAVRRVVHTLRYRALLVQPSLIVGAGREGQMLEWHAYRSRSDGLRVLGFVDDSLPPGTAVNGKLHVLGGIDALPGLIATHHIERVLVATADLREGDALRVLQSVLLTNAEVALAPDLFRTLTTDGQLVRLAGESLLVVGKVRITGSDAVLKGLLDLLGALLLLIVTAPLWLLIAMALKLSSPGPIFTRLPALGEGGVEFQALKFRTTRVSPAVAQHPEVLERRRRGLPVREQPDMAPLGHILRRYSLDELPQLLNVLMRQMSLVGPYKISPDQVKLYGGRHLPLLTMRPGITGVCQIYGRGELTVEERSLLDAEYVRTYSIWRDLQILVVTVPAVLHGRGAY